MQFFIRARLIPCVVTLLSILASSDSSGKDDLIQFSRDILPILSDRCFHCHGPDEAVREADLRLDMRESAIQKQGDNAPIVPGNASISELMERISTDDEDLLMPPPDSGRKRLSAEEVAKFKAWINGGAEWGKHWSFEKPTRPALPIKDKHPIDSFIENRLRKVGLTLSRRADKRTLIRRLSLDLTGLPPTPEEVKQFLADNSKDAYEKVVDRLLASPHYGERMAWPWLDAARYADSSGYQGDPERTMWPWRDWAIRALNENMPFNQFTIEQLAGDLLPQATQEQRLATGFNRNHMHNSEGGRIAEETRIENVFDRAETTGTVWLGMTLQCARCHDHKFDPTTNADYYRFFDFFNQTSENGRTDRSIAVPPSMEYRPAKAQQELESLDARLSELRNQLTLADPKADAEQKVWEQQWSSFDKRNWSPFELVTAKSLQGATIKPVKDSIIHVTGKNPDKDVYVLDLKSDQKKIGAIRLDALVDPASPAKGTGRDEKGNFVLSEIEIYSVSKDGDKEKTVKHKFSAAIADMSQGGLTVDKAIDGVVSNDNGWAVNGHVVKAPRWAIFQLASPLELSGETRVQIRLRFESQHTNHTLAKFRLSALARSNAIPKATLPDSAVLKILNKESGSRNKAEKDQLRSFYRERHSKRFSRIAEELKQVQSDRDRLVQTTKPVKVMVMDSLPKPRETFILLKGIYNSRTEKKVVAGVPGMLPELKPNQPNERLNRLDLANWIVSRENPLTARVTVNRFWQTFFGRGLVDTPNDFGLQGKQPSHPGLLDWLAIEFMDSGWNVKQLHKTIVMSETYQQISHVTDEALEIDPDNRWLGRSPRYRLPSWMIRDQALAASGLLNRKIGGPPVKPYQPQGVWAEATFGKKKYRMDQGDSLYRRSIYTFWRRIIGPTMFFDASKRQTCEVKPNRTNTPLHALTVLNDTTYVEAARLLAEKAIKTRKSSAERIAFVFEQLCARPPEAQEQTLLKASFEKMTDHFSNKPDDAKRLLAVGMKPADATLNPAETAALTTLVNMLMNLDEVLVRP